MGTNNEAGAILSAEQDADLRRLESMAAEGDQEPVEMPEGGEEAAPVVSDAESWAMIPGIVGSTLAMAFPELRAVYSQDACMAWGHAMVPVANKYGWSSDGIIGPEIGLLAASLPFVLGTAQVIKHHRAERAALERAKAEESQAAPVVPTVVVAAEAAPEVVDSGKTVTFGAPAAAPSRARSKAKA